MTIYVDSSALVKRYIAEPESQYTVDVMAADPSHVTARHTMVEVRRALAVGLDDSLVRTARTALARDLASFVIVGLDTETCALAAEIAEQTLVRTLDALHLGAARRIGDPEITFLTFDVRQAAAARNLGLTVVGA